MKKKITYILDGREKHITPEEKVLQPLPHKDFRFANPFIVLHHLGPDIIEAGQQLRIHPHPHRGFAPVTFQLQGSGYHKDNAGHEETINAGDVQWMFAGKGLLHSEGPSPALLEKGGTQELLQLWVNVPAKNKWDAPSYQSAKKETLPKAVQQNGVELRLASGRYYGFEGPLKSITPIISLIGEVAKGARIQLNAIPNYWALLYIIKGKILINCETIEAHNLLIFEKENDEIILSAEEDAQILFLCAEPILEPVAAKDNFVMNSQEEISQAMEDYKNGVFGTLNF
ncbi:pirin family protein [Arachidicoccus sp.]|uniref:pirin family protein n=1 Tax=Arachidicoccus sp. TaxID=1872624 RepID=UPI003D1F74BD